MDTETYREEFIKEQEQKELREARQFFSDVLYGLGVNHRSHIPYGKEKQAYTATDKTARIIIGERIACLHPQTKKLSDRFTNFPCPHCKQSDATFFYFDGGFARCTHRNSCIGWFDSVYNLAKHYNVD